LNLRPADYEGEGESEVCAAKPQKGKGKPGAMAGETELLSYCQFWCSRI
jgi:hypothetical protein